MKRLFDIFFAFFLVPFIAVPFTLITFAIKATSKGPAIHWSKRIGKNNKIFLMPKFRSMYIDSPQVATHLLTNPDQFITPIGRIIRKTSLDELPQIISIIKGDMSFVGPRPALFNQYDLMEMRTNVGVEKLLPGVTGWAQINGRDEIPLEKKVQLDYEYLKRCSIAFDIKIIFITFINVVIKKDISH